MTIKMKKNIKKITALITAFTMLLLNMPNIQIFGETESDVTITVTVVDAKGNPVEDSVFLSGGSVVSFGIGTEKNEYILFLNEMQIKNNSISVYSESRSDIVNTFDIKDGVSDYGIELGEYIQLNNEAAVFDKDTVAYAVLKEYNSNTNEYILDTIRENVKYEIIFDETTSEGVNIEEDTGKITYATPGIIYVRGYSDDDYIKDTYFKLFLSNNPRFLYDENSHIYGATVSRSESDSTLVGKVQKTISSADDNIQLKLSCAYDDISYQSKDISKAEADSSGLVTIKGTGVVEIEAISKHTGESAVYTLEIIPSYKDFEVKAGDISISDGNTLQFNAVEDIGTCFKVDVIGDDLTTDVIKFTTSGGAVAGIDSNGNITINGVGTAEITVSVNTGNYWTKYNTMRFNIEVNKSDTDINVKPKEGYEVFNGVIIINDADSIYQRDESGNGLKLELPIDIEVNDINGNISGATVELSSEGLNINGTFVNNPDYILRNQEFIVLVKYDGDNNYNPSEAEIRFKIDGTITNNNGLYEVSGLHTGADGYFWKTKGMDVVVKGKEDYKVSNRDVYSTFNETYTIPCPTAQSSRADHIIYVRKGDEIITTRLYFGVDENDPEVTTVEFSENVIVKDYGIFSNESFTIKVNATDIEDNLYQMDLYLNGKNVDGQKVIKESNGNGYFEFYIDKEQYSGLNKENQVIVYDRAGNSKRYDINDILMEGAAPEGKVAVEDKKGNIVYEKAGKIYAGGEITLLVSVDDNIENIDDKAVSGLSGYKVYVNDILVDNKAFKTQNTKQVQDSTVKINTEIYTKSDKSALEIKITDIYDNAGNKGEDVEQTVYIDVEAPTVDIRSVSASKGENITDYGSFYNAAAIFTFKAKDNCTKITDAKINIGDKSYPCEISDDGIIVFELKGGMYGNMSISLTDEVRHTAVYALSDIKTTMGERRFLDDYVMVDTSEVKCGFYVSRDYDKGSWYNDGISCSIRLEEKIVSSGINKISIYINNIPYKEYTYKNKDNSIVEIPVKIDREWIDKAVNESGTYRITVKAVDNAGNEALKESTYKIDTVAPVISEFTGVEAESNNTGIVTLNVEVKEKHFYDIGNRVTVDVIRSLDGETKEYEAEEFIATSETAKKSYTFTEDGIYTVVVKAEDGAGNKAEEKTIHFIIDNTAPICEITGIEENAYYRDIANMRIKVTESNYETNEVRILITRKLNGTEYEVAANVFNSTNKESEMNQSFTEEGTYTVKVDAVDESGNTGITRTVIFTVDTDAPVIDIQGVSNEGAYKGDITPFISISDNYFKEYSITLTKTGVYLKDNETNIENIKDKDVTNQFIKDIISTEKGIEGSFDTFEKIQENDGVYTLKVEAYDLAGRVSEREIFFSINRYGSVYTFNEPLRDVMGEYVTEVKEDFVITEYNADRLCEESVSIQLARDGSLMSEIIYETTPVNDTVERRENGWYQYEYRISKENFKYDGVYVVSVTSTDKAGNRSQTLTYDNLYVRFALDKTKPELVIVTGLEKGVYNAEEIEVGYQIFDAIGVREIRVYVNEEEKYRVLEPDDKMSYKGVFYIKEGLEQEIRFEIEDLAGNITDSSNEEDIRSGKVADFTRKVTVSTNFFIRWYSNKLIFFGSIGAIVIIAGAAIMFVKQRRRRK